MKFEFDEWATLHKVDPEAFEARRSTTLERLLQSVDDDSRLALEQTLFRAEMLLRRSKRQHQGAIEASNLMWESFGKLRAKANELEAITRTSITKGKNTLKLVTGDQLQVVGQEDDAIGTGSTSLNSKSARVFQFPAKR